ncbi:hypothetical protein DMN91_005796 [Ooceraea biroi]|uniref:Transmembrane protein 199 n=1 Tax=Ooceraea biroi TaxID=2015173 RepID=A0A026W1Y6_OOCBI|nr:transmembrane protein 199 [Ooceraea biroi]EZA50077.1 hypothetical protein X777_11520 [Ooceraea biroi]RLU21423.1 hypothetical protein DMN91_005796 [Ooceraea biroi]
MPLESIADPTIRIKPSSKMINFISCNARDSDAPANIRSLYKSKRSKEEKIAKSAALTLADLRWLNDFLIKYRKTATKRIYLHELLVDSDVILPAPRETPRNPELEARIQKLTAQQNAREYQAMTKSIDSVRKFLPEDTIAYQMKQINKQLIAVVQFLFSVLAAFAFGFIGVEYIVGNLDFGFRLLLGIICALIVALAEIYFLALKLNEDIDVTPKSTKLHED